MKLFWCCIVAALISISNSAVDVERTVQQVESILKANTLLPRLTREEILQLLNDIKAEDAKNSASRKQSKQLTPKPIASTTSTTTSYSNEENEINSVTLLPDLDQNLLVQKDTVVSASAQPQTFEATTKSNEPSVMVVLPYTPRDGSSLQELYTKPPRVEVVPVSKVTPKPLKTLKSNEEILKTLEKNAELAKKQQLDLPAELQAFLDAHGLKANSGKDHFLLPLEGFKPLPPARVIDGTVQLPENILLTYDLISPNTEIKSLSNNQAPSQNNFLYEPLRPQIPFELDISASETDESVLPYDLPKSRRTKSVNPPKPNYEPIDYDSVKVIPLRQGPSPVEDERAVIEIDQNKRQVNTSDENPVPEISTTENTPDIGESKEPITNAPPIADSNAEADSGASITDLEASFGGPAPEMPGDSELPPPKKNGFYWMLDWNSFLEVGDGDTKVNIRFEPKLGDPQMFLPVNVP